MSTDDAEIGNRLLSLRKQTGLSQTEYAASLGVSLSAYQNYERGQRTVPTEVLKGLVWKYDVNLIWLISGRGPEHLVPGSSIDSEAFGKILSKLESDGSPLKGRNSVDFGYFAALVYNRVNTTDRASWDAAVQQAITTLDSVFAAQWLLSIENMPATLYPSWSSETQEGWNQLVEDAKRRSASLPQEVAGLNWGPGSELERLFVTAAI